MTDVIKDVEQIIRLTQRAAHVGDTRLGWEPCATVDRIPEIERIAKDLLRKLSKPVELNK